MAWITGHHRKTCNTRRTRSAMNDNRFLAAAIDGAFPVLAAPSHRTRQRLAPDPVGVARLARRRRSRVRA
ncbi:MAG: hypothetical protein KGN16_21490 [Burkholderiales bacterium]|nr:hypothetical protein [Burkholderiales bacterium]